VVNPTGPAGDAGGHPIAFGTSGWRGIRDGDFTVPRVRKAVRAVASWLSETVGGGEVVIAHDTRPGGAEFVAVAAQVLAAGGFRAIVADGAVPTPTAVHAMRSRGAAAAIVFTASHNPPEFAGMKVFGAHGGILDDAASRRIEALSAEAPARPAGEFEADAAESSVAETIEAITPYLESLLGGIDRASLRNSELRVVYDAMHAAGAGVLDRALRESGVEVRTLRAMPDPEFGGAAPDPADSRLAQLRAEIRDQPGRVLGVATDGDADRFAIVSSAGHCLQATDALALLVDHLAATGRVERGIAISLATGTLVERVAAAHGLRVERHPIGFKFLSRALESGSVDAAGEESGGFALARFGCDKDGILAGLLFAEMLAGAGPSLAERLAALRRRYGTSVCGRLAAPADEAAKAALAGLSAAPPERLDGAAVERVTLGDGLHLALEDGFLMLRRSGTESLLRIYAEAPDPGRLERRLEFGRALLADRGLAE
jgi:phosphoglucomutase